MYIEAIPLEQMDHVALPTSDAGRGERFYCNVLGFKSVPRPSFSFDGRWLEHPAVGVMLHLIHNDDLVPPTPSLNSKRGHFAIRCADVDQARSILERRGIEFVEHRLPDLGYRQLFFRDPDGNVVEIGEWPAK